MIKYVYCPTKYLKLNHNIKRSLRKLNIYKKSSYLYFFFSFLLHGNDIKISLLICPYCFMYHISCYCIIDMILFCSNYIVSLFFLIFKSFFFLSVIFSFFHQLRNYETSSDIFTNLRNKSVQKLKYFVKSIYCTILFTNHVSRKRNFCK